MGYDVLPLTKLIEQFERMPGIGKKSAQRLAFYVLDMPTEKAKAFASVILEAHEKIHRCSCCQNLTDQKVCQICSDTKRDSSIICVVEDPKDVIAIERTQEYHGMYHVLHGLLSPMNGIGPDQLTVKELMGRLSDSRVQEVIMATNPTVEGEATATFLARMLKPMGIKVSRLAYGIPVGGNLEYADEVTLYRAIEGRREI